MQSFLLSVVMKLVMRPWRVIFLIVLCQQVNCMRSLLFNRALLWIEGNKFAQSFYYGSKPTSTLTPSLVVDTLENASLKSFQPGSSTSPETGCREFLARSGDICAVHLHHILKKLDANQGEISLITFIDSFAKPLAGVRSGNLDWNGHSPQCESTSVSVQLDQGGASNFKGKYCKIEWHTPLDSNHSLMHSTGVCIPSSCGKGDIKYLKLFLEDFSFLKISQQSHITKISCNERNSDDKKMMIFYTILSTLILLGILSTAYGKLFAKNIESRKNLDDTRSLIILAFSINRNWATLFDDEVPRDQIIIIDYVKGVCALLLVFWHGISILSPSFAPDPQAIVESMYHTKFVWLSLRSILTIFFFFNGFLLHSGYTKSRHNFSPLRSIFKHFLRLSPSYYFCVLARVAYVSQIGLGSELSFGYFDIDRSLCANFNLEEFTYTYNQLASVVMVSET